MFKRLVTIILTAIITAGITLSFVKDEHNNDSVHVICEVVGRYDAYEDGYTYSGLICKMPNGEFKKYPIQDAPEGNVTLVCFETENQDDYSSYEIVATEEFELLINGENNE